MLQRFSLFMGRALTFRLEDLRREDGQTTLEYTVVSVLVVAMAGAVFVVFEGAVTSAVNRIAGLITSAIAGL
ncbi:MAG: Flp family type IVb pilin [Gaiellaceae bacterium]